MSFILQLQPQECDGDYDFTKANICMTCGFKDAFADESTCIIRNAISTITKKYGNHADYLQVLICNGIKFFAIHDREYITFLLADEY